MADPTGGELDAHASDPNLVAYIDKGTRQLVFKKKTSDPAVLQSRAASGLVHAAPEDIDLRKRYLSNTTAGAQAESAAMLAANVATFGMAGFDDPAQLQQIKDFREQSPTLSALTEVAGSVAPAVIGAGAAGAAMRAAGFAGRAVGLGTMAAEELAQSAAIAQQQATEEGRRINLTDVVQGLPLAFGLSAASRIARGASRYAAAPLDAAASRVRGLTGGAAEGLEAAAEEGANAVSRGRATSKARRSVGAAGTDGATELTEAEVKSYVDNFDDVHRETERVGGDAIEDALGGPTAAFDEVHSLKNKAADLDGKMGDARWDRVEKESAKQQQDLNDIAAYAEAQGQKQTARKARAMAAEIAAETNKALEVGDAVHAARAGDRGKQFADALVSKYGAVKGDITAKDLAEFVGERADRMRGQLEKKSIYGKSWSDYQRETNALWSGNDGIIASGRVWQAEFLERSAAGRVRKGYEEFPVFQVKGDVVQHALNMTDRDFARTVGALRTWADKVEKMTLTKAELGANTLGHTPVMRLQQSIEDMRAFANEVERMRKVKHRGADALARKAAEPIARGTAEQLFEAGKQIPGVGQMLSTADLAAKKLTGKSIGERLYEPKIKPPREELSREAARARVLKRHGRSVERPYAPPGDAIPPPGPDGRSAPEGGAIPAPGPRRADARGSADVAAMAGAGALAVGGLAATPAITDALADISEDNRTIRERAATGLIVKAARQRPLPGQLERFREGAPSLAAAYAVKLDDLQQALNDPRALVTGIADAYGAVADHHEDLYVELVQRTAAAAEYVLANAPPSVGISVVNPDGVAPDTIALAQFAQLWSGAMNPGDVIYDVGTGSATPTQIKALREVHPDIYGALRNDVLKQVDRATMPFETLRQLDVLFDLPGISGPAFSPDMTKTMQAVWKQPANPSKSAASGAQAPTSANAQFAAGPTRMR